MRVNRQIRALKVRVISQTGEQIGVLTLQEALVLAEQDGVDLVEIVPTATPPVCKIIDYGKYRYDQTKREKESKKAQHQIKVKELKLKPNINDHDFEVKLRHAREFVEKGNKVKVSVVFRGREMAHPEIGQRLISRMVESLQDTASAETPAKMFGRMLTVVFSPTGKKPKVAQK